MRFKGGLAGYNVLRGDALRLRRGLAFRCFLQKNIFISGTRLRSGKSVAAHKIAKDAI